ncbi:Uncharacterised protein [Raoultella planticola]|uniref:Uncharacterized protein n=1 Tax=Raoultella planticola TaxID=575 RepID=A0A485ARC5_RAOPL|nr:Uncharacterised protein [Raoultella planticola]
MSNLPPVRPEYQRELPPLENFTLAEPLPLARAAGKSGMAA